MDLTPAEILDLQHCRRTDPEWAKTKAGHYLADAEACDVRLRESLEFVAHWAKQGNVAFSLGMSNTAQNYEAMAARYRKRAAILMGENT